MTKRKRRPLKRYERRSAEDREAYLARVRRQLEEDQISMPALAELLVDATVPPTGHTRQLPLFAGREERLRRQADRHWSGARIQTRTP